MELLLSLDILRSSAYSHAACNSEEMLATKSDIIEIILNL